jgi:hypothetical protein
MRHAQSNLRHLSNLLLNTEEMDEETRVETQELKDKVTDIMEALQHGAPEVCMPIPLMRNIGLHNVSTD